MAFRYRLQAVLRLRSSLERQEEQRLTQAAGVVARLRAEIEELEERRFEEKRRAFQELAAGSAGAIFQFLAAGDMAYAEKKRALGLELEKAEKRRLELLERYKKVRQDREILERLRERQEEAYNLEFARREQQTADEAFLNRSLKHSNE
ncbi:MAG TPA: flagellar FliJ family protein [Methylomirabilota bacterium]|nr:flagellar FliJ family protein [Methylomirabilota bacterium]